MSVTETEDRHTYDNMIEKVLDDENIAEALERVVSNRGAPGVDGMTVHELAAWLPANVEDLKERVRSGKYRPGPVRRVEIPKPDGGVRELGVPNVVDRLLQQAVAQVLTPVYDPTFSDNSFGFRPGRSAHDAIARARAYYDEGYVWVVDLDLSRFFDTIHQDILMNILRKDIGDRALMELIKRFLRSGVALPDGLVVSSDRGSPQGGPLSPLLANVYLDRFDRLLESRGLRFVRYADDVNIYVRTERAAQRVMRSCINYLEGKRMKLVVNREKSAVGSPSKLRFLGFSILRQRKGTGITIHPKSLTRFRKRVRELTRRNRGDPIEKILSELKSFARGWAAYYGIGLSAHRARSIDEWMRKRVRQIVFKRWKTYGTRFRELVALCPQRHRLPDGGPDGYWKANCSRAASRTPWSAMRYDVVYLGMNLDYLRGLGMYFLSDDGNAVRQGA